MPVPSNIPRVAISRNEARERLGIAPTTSVFGLFGTAHMSRLMPIVQLTVDSTIRVRKDVKLVYIGPDRAMIEPLFGDVGIYTTGHVDDDEVSRRFSAMDVTLSTFVDGVSSRRGSLMTSLQHGIAAVGTVGKNTDSIFRNAASSGPLLVDVADADGFAAAAINLMENPTKRKEVAENGHRLYQENFDLMHLAQKIKTALQQNT